jgi:hypothetical protein
MNLINNILGCFVASGYAYAEDSQEIKSKSIANGEIFDSYIYKEKGVYEIISRLERDNYGRDMELILFQFHVNPIPYILPYLKEIESYRKKEKSIGVTIIITDENFFNKYEQERYDFIKTSIMQKMDLVEEVVKKKKLDTDMELLKKDLVAVLEQWQPE